MLEFFAGLPSGVGLEREAAALFQKRDTPRIWITGEGGQQAEVLML